MARHLAKSNLFKKQLRQFTSSEGCLEGGLGHMKIFRNFRLRMLQNNRVSKYLLYAIGEIVLVVIGILIALKVNTWNLEKETEKREDLLLSEINKDFTKNLDDLSFTTQGHRNSLRSTEWLLERHSGFHSISRDSMKYHLTNMMSAFTYNPAQATVTSIINTNSIEIIENERLRRLLLMWTDIYTDYAEEEEQSLNAFNNPLIPFINEKSNSVWFSPFE